MAETKFRYFEFGEFRVDTHRRILQKNGVPVHLTPRSFDLLCVMIENAGRVLEHDELLDKVWEGTFVEQGNLKKTVSTLRQVLGESPETSEFITTVPRKGYRFTAPVRPVSDEAILIRETKAEIIVEEEFDDGIAVAGDPPMLPAAQGKRFWSPLVILTLAALVIIPIAVFLGLRYFSAGTQHNFSVEKVRLTRAFSGDNINNGTLSGNGNFFVYTVSEDGKNSFRVKYAATGSEVELIPFMNASFWYATFSPDGNHIYFYLSNRDEPAKSGVYRIPTLGGALQLISEQKYAGLRFSPDGTRLAAFRTFVQDGRERQELLTINADGNDERKIVVLPDYKLFRGIAWSPDGQGILCGIIKQAPFEKAASYISEFSLSDGAETILLPEQEILLFVDDWFADKKSILLRQREPNSEAYQIWQYFPGSGEKRRVTNDDYLYNQVSITTDGKTLGAIRNFGLTSVWTADSENYDFRQITADGGYFFNIGWTADNRLVFSTTENMKEFVGIMNADGTKKRLLTEGADGIRVASEISADGKSIVFMSERTGGRQVWNVDLEGRNLKKLTNSPGIGRARLLADGQTLIFSHYLKTATWAVMKQSADGRISEIFSSDTHGWDISPDEKYLAIFAPDEQTKKNRLFVRELASGTVIKTFDVESLGSLRWTPDGQALSFVRTKNNVFEIVLQPLDGTPEKVLTKISGEEIRNIAWSRDGKKIAIVRNRLQNEAVLIKEE